MEDLYAIPFRTSWKINMYAILYLIEDLYVIPFRTSWKITMYAFCTSWKIIMYGISFLCVACLGLSYKESQGTLHITLFIMSLLRIRNVHKASIEMLKAAYTNIPINILLPVVEHCFPCCTSLLFLASSSVYPRI